MKQPLNVLLAATIIILLVSCSKQEEKPAEQSATEENRWRILHKSLYDSTVISHLLKSSDEDTSLVIPKPKALIDSMIIELEIRFRTKAALPELIRTDFLGFYDGFSEWQELPTEVYYGLKKESVVRVPKLRYSFTKSFLDIAFGSTSGATWTLSHNTQVNEQNTSSLLRDKVIINVIYFYKRSY